MNEPAEQKKGPSSLVANRGRKFSKIAQTILAHRKGDSFRFSKHKHASEGSSKQEKASAYKGPYLGWWGGVCS